MGGGSSKVNSPTSVSTGTNPAVLKRRHTQTMSRVERFVSAVYSTCPSVESMWLILTNKLGQKAFYQFVRAENYEYYFTVFRDLSEILSEKDISLESYINHFERIKEKVLDCEGDLIAIISPFLRNELSLGPHNDEGKLDSTHIKNLLERTQNELVNLMARDLFNRFIDSKYYKNWRVSENSHATVMSYEDASVTPSNEFGGSSATSTKSSMRSLGPPTASIRFRSRMKSVVKPATLCASAFGSVDNRDLEAVLTMSDTWLAALITAVEALPVCFTLASASSDRQGFPLIYVNRYFERVTGYDRTALIGKACKDFLQCEETEPASVEVLREALKTASPACAILSNRAFDGRVFKNLVAIKPIVDENKKYKYVVGLHFDLSKEFDQGRSKMNLVKDLFAFIPESIVCDETALATPNTSAKS